MSTVRESRLYVTSARCEYMYSSPVNGANGAATGRTQSAASQLSNCG